MDRLLLDDTVSLDGRAVPGSGRKLTLRPPGLGTNKVVLSGSSLEFIVKTIAVLNFAVGLLCLLGNIMFLFLLVSYPLHEFDLIQITILNADPNHNVFHLANLSKKQLVLMLTLTSLYFMMELMIAKVLYFGAHKRSKSKCQLWVDIHRFVWVILVLSLVYNMFDMGDPTAAVLVYTLWPVSVLVALSIYSVNVYVRDITRNQDFTYATFQIEKA